MRKLHDESKDVAFPSSAAVKVRVNAKYLAELAEAIHKMACSDEDAGLDLVVPVDPSRPVVLEKETDEIKIRSILMPLVS